MKLLLTGLLLTVFLSSDSTAEESAQPTPIDINKLPTPGRDAVWAYNPKTPNQKILLVPSQHNLNLRFIRPDLAKEMKSMDVLIVEQGTVAPSWDDAEAMKEAFIFTIEDLKKAGAIRDHPFGFEDPVFSPGKKLPWTDYVKKFDPGIVPHMEKIFKPILGNIPLQNVHPGIIVTAMARLLRMKTVLFFGMDHQIIREFNLKKKPIFDLETYEEKVIFEGARDLISYIKENTKEETIAINLITKIIADINSDLNQIKIDSPKEFYDKIKNFISELDKRLPWTKETEEMGSLAERNQLWLPKLIKYFENSPKSSFVVVVGAAHFPGPTAGLLTLLSKEGFTFTSFGTGAPPTVEYVGIQKKPTGPLPETEQKKAATKAEIDSVTHGVDEALKTGLPEIEEPGKSEKKEASSIRSELINAMLRLSSQESFKMQKPKWHLDRYISVRNSIMNNSEIKNKAKAVEILERNPNFDVEQLLQAYKKVPEK